MKICMRPFKNMYVDFNSQIRFCGWTSGEPLGTVLDGVDKAWNSPRAQNFREAILKGDFRFCRQDVCPFMMNDTLPENSGSSIDDLYNPYPTEIQMAYDYQCNLSCPSCRTKPIVASARAKEFFDKVKNELKPYLDKAQMIDFGGHGDPFFSRHSQDMIAGLSPTRDDFALSIQTNGLCFSPDVWKRMEHLSRHHITFTISIDSLNPNVYNRLRRGGSLKKLLQNIDFMASLRRAGHINSLHAVMVVQDLNFMEIPQFTEFCFKHGFDKVQLENLYNWGTFNQKEYFAKNLLNPAHPNHAFFKDILHEALKDPRVHCWAGDTDRITNNWAVTGASVCAVAEIASADCIASEASLDDLSHAIWNRDYIFVCDNGIYKGTIPYANFHTHMGTTQCIACDILTLADPSQPIIESIGIDETLKAAKELTSPHQVIPIVHNGRLIAKILRCV